MANAFRAKRQPFQDAENLGIVGFQRSGSRFCTGMLSENFPKQA